MNATHTDINNIPKKGIVRVLDKVFVIPDLNRERSVWLYLPSDYATSHHHYPVIYMHDGQNLFDASASFAGEWYIDESLDALSHDGIKGAIVVGIENSRNGETRIDEYSPWKNGRYNLGGQGDIYINFIIHHLKPYVDANYRTLRDPANTGLMGSSMGGLISLYGAIQYQHVFGRAGIFSPSFWFAGEVFSHVTKMGKQQDLKIYLIAGEKEGSNAARDTERMGATLRSAGFSEQDVFLEIHADGEHSENYWAREFPKAYQWLYIE
ncbi:MAG: alpha/beta hydrolase-fold protein [Bacteroidota bacterium]